MVPFGSLKSSFPQSRRKYLGVHDQNRARDTVDLMVWLALV